MRRQFARREGAGWSVALCAGAALALSAAAGRAQAPAPAAAPAQAAPPALFSSTGGPIDVTADGMERFANEGRTVYVGEVEVVQGAARLRCPRLTLFSVKRAANAPKPAPSSTPEGDFGSIERIEAEGPVYYVTPTQQVKGDHGTYLATPDTITVTGNVTMLQGEDVLHGDKLVIEQKTGHSTMITNAPGKGPQRVRGVFFPKDKPAPGAKPGAPAAPPPATPAKPS